MRWLVVGRAVAMAAATVVVISIVAFLATSVRSPETIAISVLGTDAATPELVQRFIEEHGLNRPVHVRYLDWASGVLRGDLGVSLSTGRSVASDIGPRFVRTLQVTLLSLAVAIPLSLWLGVYMAAHSGTRREMGLVAITVTLAALPEFVKGAALMVIFSVYLAWLPVDSSGLTFGQGWAAAQTYILPVATLAIHLVPYLARMTRAAAREAFAAPHTRMAVLLGIPRRQVVWTYAMRASAVPLVNVIALNIMWLLGGVIVVENLFGFPGLGRLLVSAIFANDTPTIVAITVILGAMFVVISLVADLVAAYLNPRLRAT